MILSPIAGVCRITQKFGERPDVYKQFGLRGHNGIDFTGQDKRIMEKIYSPIEGIVTVVKDDGKAGYGKFVKIRTTGADDKGRIKEVVLGHMSEITVKQGQYVYTLDPVGVEGNTGFSSGAHLHFGLRFIDAKTGDVINYGNGYAGYIDFFPYLLFWASKEQQSAYPIIV